MVTPLRDWLKFLRLLAWLAVFGSWAGGWWWSAGSHATMLNVAVVDSVSPALRSAVEKFWNEKQIEIRIREYSYGDLYQVLKTPPASGETAFDVATVDTSWLYLLKSLRPIRDFQQRDNVHERLLGFELPNADAFVEEALRPAEARCPDGGHETLPCYAGVPYGGNTQLFCAKSDGNLTLAQQWDDATTGRHRHAVRAAESDLTEVADDFLPIYWSELARQADNSDGQGVRRAVKAALSILATMRESFSGTRTDFNTFDVGALLLSGAADSGIVFSHWAIRIRREASRANKSIVCGHVPGFVPRLGVWYLSIPRESKSPELAKEFIRSATSREAMILAATLGNSPTRTDVLDLGPGDAATLYAQKEAMEHARVFSHCGERLSKPLDDVQETIGRQLIAFYQKRATLDVVADGITSKLANCEVSARAERSQDN